MAINKKPMSHDEIVNELIHCANSIILNADSIVGKERYLTNLTVSIYFDPGELPRINVDRDFVAERFLSD